MAPLTTLQVTNRLRELDVTLVNYRDPVDGAEAPVLDLAQVGKLLEHYDAQRGVNRTPRQLAELLAAVIAQLDESAMVDLDKDGCLSADFHLEAEGVEQLVEQLVVSVSDDVVARIAGEILTRPPQPIRIEGPDDAMDIGAAAERQWITKALSGPHVADSGLDSATLATVLAMIERNEGPGRWSLTEQRKHLILTTSDEPPKVCRCGEPPHGESLERPASLWVN